jgi:hypothetical protein
MDRLAFNRAGNPEGTPASLARAIVTVRALLTMAAVDGEHSSDPGTKTGI